MNSAHPEPNIPVWSQEEAACVIETLHHPAAFVGGLGVEGDGTQPHVCTAADL
jgi:hypothetical protein